MSNKYLEKVAFSVGNLGVTGLEAAGMAAIGASSSKKNDQLGGAVSGVAGGAAGLHMGKNVGSKLAEKIYLNKNVKGKNIIKGIDKVLKYHSNGALIGGVAGAYLGAKAYSKIKHGND